MAWPLKLMMCEPERLMATSSASSPLMRSASSTARVIESTAASGSTTTPLRRPRASDSPMPTMSMRPPSPGSPMMQVTRLVPTSSPTVWVRFLAIRVSLLHKTGGGFRPARNSTPASLDDASGARRDAVRVLRRARLLRFGRGGRPRGRRLLLLRALRYGCALLLLLLLLLRGRDLRRGRTRLGGGRVGVGVGAVLRGRGRADD